MGPEADMSQTCGSARESLASLPAPVDGKRQQTLSPEPSAPGDREKHIFEIMAEVLFSRDQA